MILIRLFLTFMKIGFVGFGGGLAIIPLIYQGVTSFIDMSEAEFANLFAIAQSTPGPIALNAATYSGYEVAGIPGAIAATIGVSFPAFILVVIACRLIAKYGESLPVKGALTGIRPAALGLVGSAIIVIGKGALFDEEVSLAMGFSGLAEHFDPVAAVLAVLSFVLCTKYRMGVIKVILLMGVLGAVFCSGFIDLKL